MTSREPDRRPEPAADTTVSTPGSSGPPHWGRRRSTYAVYGVLAGLISVGIAGLIGLLFYGDSNPAANVLPIVVTVALTAVAGFAADPILTWLTSAPARRR